MAKKRLWITNLKANVQVFYFRDPDPGLPPNVDGNKDCKLIIEPAESKSIDIEEADIPALKKRIAGIEGLRIDSKR